MAPVPAEVAAGGPPDPERLLELLLSLGSDAALVVDRARRVVWSSPNARALLAGPEGGGKQAERPIAPWTRLNLVLDDPRAGDLVGRALAGGEVCRGELRQNEWRRVLRAVAAPIEGGAEAQRVLLVLSDITSERRLSRAHQELIANLSHDLRTPLASLRLLADTLTGEAQGDPEATRDFAGRIALEAERLHTLVSGILDLGRLEAGVEHAAIELVDLHQVVQRAVERVRPQAKERQLSLWLRGHETRARADPTRLDRALTNILDNALKFTSPKGTVTVTVGESTGRPTVSVRDSGSGIPPSQLPRIFDRFYTGDRSRAGRSSGLGLTIAKQAVELQGGEIKVRSAPGRGTLVRIVLAPA